MNKTTGKKSLAGKVPARLFRNGFLLLCLLLTGTLFPQKQKDQPKTNELQVKKKKLTEDIRNLNAVLNETKRAKNMTMLHVQALNQKISSREQLIQVINAEIKLINSQIGKKQREITQKNAELDTLKTRYRKMVYYAYRNKEAYNKLMFVFAADNFNQAYARVKYMQEINEKRRAHAASIVKKQEELAAQQQELEQKILAKKSLLTAEEQEKINLAKEKGQQEEELSKFASREKQVKDELDQKKKDAQALEKKIKEMIEEMALKAEKARIERERAAKEKAEKERLAKNSSKNSGKNSKGGKPDPEAPKAPELTKEAEDLSEDFASNKGKLPWPVTKGVITETFGLHEHPKIRNFDYVNNGVDISTPKGTIARAIFDGEVTGVASMPDGNGKFVIVRHGSYLSVYTNLGVLYVKTGDKIKVKQNIGEIEFDEEKGGTTMNLQIWKGGTKLNPEDWLYKGG